MSPDKATMIIPYFNEAATVRRVVKAVLDTGCVAEVLVVDDGSGNPCPRFPSPARLIRRTVNGGDGAARRHGIAQARGEVIGFCDADLATISTTGLRRLFRAVLEGECDMAIGALCYPAGREPRLNTYLAQPLLRRFFPELAAVISSPLSGIRVSQRRYLFPDRLEPRSCMLGMTLDAWHAGARLKEYDIGVIENPGRPVGEKIRRADIVLSAALDRCQAWGRLSPAEKPAISLAG